MGFIAFYAVGAYLAALLASPHLLEVFPILAGSPLARSRNRQRPSKKERQTAAKYHFAEYTAGSA
jgi:ABC-type branched-subunit amino acid transport system permease subunit